MAIYASKTWADGKPVTISELNAYIGVPINALGPFMLTGQTTNATPLRLWAIAVPELACLTVNGHVFGMRSDSSAALIARFGGTWRRASGGNVILAGSYCDVVEDSAGAPTAALAADTGTQEAYLTVTGIAAQTWNWRVCAMTQWL